MASLDTVRMDNLICGSQTYSSYGQTRMTILLGGEEIRNSMLCQILKTSVHVTLKAIELAYTNSWIHHRL